MTIWGRLTLKNKVNIIKIYSFSCHEDRGYAYLKIVTTIMSKSEFRSRPQYWIDQKIRAMHQNSTVNFGIERVGSNPTSVTRHILRHFIVARHNNIIYLLAKKNLMKSLLFKCSLDWFDVKSHVYWIKSCLQRDHIFHRSRFSFLISKIQFFSCIPLSHFGAT